MPNPAAAKFKLPTAWSFSRYSVYKLCPAKFKYSVLLKLPEPKGAALERGGAIHKLAEDYIKGKLPRLPNELATFAAEFKQLKALHKKKLSGLVVEDNWAFTNKWAPTEWDNWIECWVRIKLDCAHHTDETTMVVKDWKTGKLRPELHEEYLEQIELYALAALLLHEWLERVRIELCYLDLGVVYPDPEDPKAGSAEYVRADIPRLKKLWEKRVAPMFKDRIFAPRPNQWCRTCHYRAANGGPCKY